MVSGPGEEVASELTSQASELSKPVHLMFIFETAAKLLILIGYEQDLR
jgi:hypothetical protein